MVCQSVENRVTIIYFRIVRQKGLKNEDKVGKTLFFKKRAK